MPELSDEAKNKLESLRQKYILSFPDKVEVLERCWNDNDLEELHMKCHKIAGSSASFDFQDISSAAQTLEALSRTRLENNRTAKIVIKNDKTLVNSYAVLLKILNKNIREQANRHPLWCLDA